MIWNAAGTFFILEIQPATNQAIDRFIEFRKRKNKNARSLEPDSHRSHSDCCFNV